MFMSNDTCWRLYYLVLVFAISMHIQAEDLRAAEQDPSAGPYHPGCGSSRGVAFGLLGVPGDTAYDKLKQLYDRGVPATWRELDGWHAGRTVCRHRPDTFFGGLLVGEMVSVGAGGPNFDRRYLLVSTLRSPPGYFDELTPHQVADYREIFRKGAGDIESPQQSATGISYRMWDPTGRPEVVTFRRNGEYLIAKRVSWIPEMDWYAYYFRKFAVPPPSRPTR